MNQAETEALSHLEKVISQLTSGNPDVKTLLRECIHVCDTLNWGAKAQLFRRELNGYLDGSPIPNYRKVPGVRIWEPSEVHNLAVWRTTRAVYGLPSQDSEQTSTQLAVIADVDWILWAAKTGYREDSGQTRQSGPAKFVGSVPVNLFRLFDARVFQRLLTQLENMILDFASKAFVQIKFGNEIENLWTEIRKEVDQVMVSVGMENHLKAIHAGLQSGNPEELRNSVFGCRNLLKDLADYLWQDVRGTYPYLPGEGEGNRLQVTPEKTKNRISAYLHQKGVHGKKGKRVRADFESLAQKIDALLAHLSEAHGTLVTQEARMLAFATYQAVAELVVNTDMQPITNYEERTTSKTITRSAKKSRSGKRKAKKKVRAVSKKKKLS